MSDKGPDRSSFANRLAQVVGEENVLANEPMSEHTTFEIGGPADLFVIPETLEQAEQVIAACRAASEPFFVLGRGSDLLVSDEGYRGTIIAMADALDDVEVDGTHMTCQAGVTLADAAEMACTLGLTDLEFACGIPGTVGGAVYMNAGAYDGEIKDILASVRALDPSGDVIDIDVADMEMGYRTSRVRTEGLVVLSATFSLEEGDDVQIRATMDDLTERRESKQPLDMPSAGSTFKRPEGYFAGKLITDAGLKGCRIGGAQVSEKHAGFVVNAGEATAEDVRGLIRHVQSEVERQFGVELEPEVRFLGEFTS